MAGEPAETAIGVAVLGFGVILVFAALKGVYVFGPHGLITTFLNTGKFVQVDQLPKIGGLAKAWSKKTSTA